MACYTEEASPPLDASEHTMPATPESILRAWFDGVWNRADESTIDRLLHSDGVIHGLPTPDGQPIRGPHNFRPFYRAFRTAFPDLSVEILNVVTQGDLAVARCLVKGTQRGSLPDYPATGLPVSFEGFAMCQMEERPGVGRVELLRLPEHVSAAGR